MVIFAFSRGGYLKSILLGGDNDQDNETLQKALNRLLNPSHFGWIRKLFR
jgi:hypothetical protein